MLRTVLFITLYLILSTGCENKTNLEKQAPGNPKKNFFPVTEYLLGQIKELNTLPVTPLKITTQNGRRDSVWIKREDINLFIRPFISPAIDSTTYHDYFSENSFLDQSINAFTFSYDPVRELPGSMEVKHWDIYVDPASSTVSRIYIVKQLKDEGAPQTIQLVWKSGYYCQVTTITEIKGKKPNIREEKLIWNFND